MKEIDFRFSSFVLSLVVIFFWAVVWYNVEWLKQLSGFSGAVFFLILIIVVFNVVDGLFLVYFKIKHKLWAYKRIDWTLIEGGVGEYGPKAVAERLKKELGVESSVIVEGVFLKFLYILSPSERYEVLEKFNFFEE